MIIDNLDLSFLDKPAKPTKEKNPSINTESFQHRYNYSLTNHARPPQDLPRSLPIDEGFRKAIRSEQVVSARLRRQMNFLSYQANFLTNILSA